MQHSKTPNNGIQKNPAFAPTERSAFELIKMQNSPVNAVVMTKARMTATPLLQPTPTSKRKIPLKGTAQKRAPSKHGINIIRTTSFLSCSAVRRCTDDSRTALSSAQYRPARPVNGPQRSEVSD